MLSAGAFTGCFNYLQLAKGLAPSQPLFVCSLQGVCAERTTAGRSYRDRKRGGGGGQGSTGQNSPGMGHAARSTGLRGKEAMVYSWPSTLLRRCQLVGLSARVDLEELSGLLVGF